MLQIAIITLREGIEAFLIVAITAGILRQTGRGTLLPAVYWGTGVVVIASFVASLFFAQAENKPLWEGFLAAAAAVMVASMTFYMWRTARTMRSHIGARIDQATQNHPTRAAWWGIFLLVLLIIFTLYEFFEAGAVPFVDNEFWHIVTEPYGPEGVYGEWLTYLMVLIPAGWLVFVWLKDPQAALAAKH